MKSSLVHRILVALRIQTSPSPQEPSRLTKKAEKQLRAAGWYPGRIAPLSTSLPRINEFQRPISLSGECGNLLLQPTRQRVLAFGPHFQSGTDTQVSQRIVSDDDLRVADAIWQFAGRRVGYSVCNVAWEENQDLHAIAVDQNGRVYSATWRHSPNSSTVDVAFMKVADSLIAWLNYWLDPSRQTRDDLHAVFPLWSEETTIAI